MVRLSIAIMAVPERKEIVYSLIKQLGRNVPIAWDDDYQGIWWNCQRAWKMVKGGATHHLILQDDALVCDNFIESAERAISYRPHDFVGFYANHQICTKASEKGDSWVNIEGGVWGQAQMLPVSEIGHFLSWCESHIDSSYKHDDDRLATYLSASKMRQYQTVPSLVNHGSPDTSTTNHSATHLKVRRVARVFTEKDALDIDWEQGLENPLYYGYPNLIADKWLLEAK